MGGRAICSEGSCEPLRLWLHASAGGLRRAEVGAILPFVCTGSSLCPSGLVSSPPKSRCPQGPFPWGLRTLPPSLAEAPGLAWILLVLPGACELEPHQSRRQLQPGVWALGSSAEQRLAVPSSLRGHLTRPPHLLFQPFKRVTSGPGTQGLAQSWAASAGAASTDSSQCYSDEGEDVLVGFRQRGRAPRSGPRGPLEPRSALGGRSLDCAVPEG